MVRRKQKKKKNIGACVNRFVAILLKIHIQMNEAETESKKESNKTHGNIDK